MTAGVIGRMPRVALVAGALGLLTATIALAAGSSLSSPAAPAPAAPAAAVPEPLVVPDVRKQAYVFAKGTLEQEGFAWRVEGGVPGYAANVVVSQSPAPGARVVAKGSPTIVLQLARNSAYPQEGTPENASPYEGTPAVLAGAAAATRAPAPLGTAAAAKPKPAAKAAKPKPAARAAKPGTTRAPAFEVAGAPAEPADEVALPVRAKQLAVWLERHQKPTPAAVNHWLYQHNWIVTGARFGWAGGAEALRTLVAVDARVQELWGIGARSEALARTALTEVEARTR